ncbi:MAG TPA: c-type cytochrome [Oceanospirillales bacterium]|nr:c-type cytochrome [Oceanospirillales bacterium]
MKLFTGVVGAAVVAIPMLFSTAAVADGAALYKAKGCAGCHKADAMGQVGPRLAGQMEAYVLEQFKLIRDGKRASGKAGMMKGAVSKVTDAEAAEIAKYVSGL